LFVFFVVVKLSSILKERKKERRTQLFESRGKEMRGRQEGNRKQIYTHKRRSNCLKRGRGRGSNHSYETVLESITNSYKN
jgi:hypothetical protein